jgi:hypothetical protein
MGSRRSIRFILFAFDALRLVAVVSMLSAFRSLFSAAGGGSLGVSAVAFAAPQALFPLLLLFNWLDPVRYVSYPPLFLAGKVISAAAIGAWLLGSAQDTFLAVGLGNTGAVLLAAVSAAVLIYDLLSALVTGYLIRSDTRVAGNEEKSKMEENATDVRPSIVIETVSEDSSALRPDVQSTDTQGGT